MTNSKTKAKRHPGISRIDQLDKRTHGYFVRLTRNGKVYNSFFADKRLGGKKQALEAAQKHYQALLREHGEMSRKAWAQIPRRKSKSGIVGVRKASVERDGRTITYWAATWSPRPHVSQRRMFSIRKYGSTKARELAIRARNAGLRAMES